MLRTGDASRCAGRRRRLSAYLLQPAPSTSRPGRRLSRAKTELPRSPCRGGLPDERAKDVRSLPSRLSSPAARRVVRPPFLRRSLPTLTSAPLLLSSSLPSTRQLELVTFSSPPAHAAAAAAAHLVGLCGRNLDQARPRDAGDSRPADCPARPADDGPRLGQMWRSHLRHL